MPEMDGMQATLEIRKREGKNPRSAHMPIIAMTANALRGDKERFIDGGMDGYVSKPLDSGKLRDAITRVKTRTDPSGNEGARP